jgi:predicted RNase H-like HicB family nuclease
MKLSIRIVQDDQGGYLAICPSLPGCMSRANSREKAKEKLYEAIRGYIASVSNCSPESVVHEVVES